MAFQYIGWGNWGREAVNICRQMAVSHQNEPVWTVVPGDVLQLVPSNFLWLVPEHFPDAISAEMYFAGNWSFASRLMGDNIRIHFINMGENFSSGAICAFFKEMPVHKESMDFIVAYMPPPGTNSVAVGRVLAYLLGERRLADVTFLLDGCAPLFCDWDEWHVATFAASVGRILQAFERSCCMLPLLLRMRSKVLSMAFDDIKRINAESSLANLWSKWTISTDGSSASDVQDCLAFSVSDEPENYLAKVYERNIKRDKLIFLPFFRRYEWKNITMPTVDKRNNKPNFTGIFGKCRLPTRIASLILEYYDACWPDGKKDGYEKPDIHVEEWMRRKRITMLHKNIQKFELVADALEYVESY